MESRIQSCRCLVALLAITGGGALTSGQTTDPARLVPAEADAYVGIRDLDGLHAALQETPTFRLDRDAGARRVFRQRPWLPRTIDALRERLAAAVGTAPSAYRHPFGGPAALFVRLPENGGAVPRPVAVVGVRDTGLMREQFDSMVQRFTSLASEVRREPAGRYEIVHFLSGPATEATPDAGHLERLLPPSPPGLAELLGALTGDPLLAAELPPSLAICLGPGILVVGVDPGDLRAVPDLSDATTTFADGELCGDLRRETGTGAAVELAVNLRRYFDHAKRRQPVLEPSLRATGLTAAHGLVGAVHFPEGTAWVQDYRLLLDGEPTGLLGLIQDEQCATADVLSVPPDALFSMHASTSPARVLDAIEAALEVIDPAAAAAMRESFGPVPTPEGDVLNVREDLVGRLDAPLTAWAAVDSPVDTTDGRLAVTLRYGGGTRGRERLLASLERIAAALPGLVTRAEGDGAPRFAVPVAGLAITVGADRLALGTPAGIDAASPASTASGPGTTSAPATGPGPHMAAPPSSALLAQAPEEAWAALFLNTPEMLNAALEADRRRATLAPLSPGSVLALTLREAFDITPGTGGEQVRFVSPSLLTVTRGPSDVRVRWVRLAATRP